MGYAIITKVKSISHSKFILAEIRVETDRHRWDREILINTGSAGDDERFSMNQIVCYENSRMIPINGLNEGLTYLLKAYDNNVVYPHKDMRIFPYFSRNHEEKAIWFKHRFHEIQQKNDALEIRNTAIFN